MGHNKVTALSPDECIQSFRLLHDKRLVYESTGSASWMVTTYQPSDNLKLKTLAVESRPQTVTMGDPGHWHVT